MNTKQELRNFFRKKRQEISEKNFDTRREFSDKISTFLLAFLEKNPPTISPQYVALFAGTPEEPDISSLIQAYSLKKLRKFCFPRIHKDEKSGADIMHFYEVSELSDLESGQFGILEPKHFCKKIAPEEISVFCIPAVSIDIKGNRIGMGGGFYDKYLSQRQNLEISGKKNLLKIGVVFSCQISEHSFLEFSEEFDIPVDMIITEKGESFLLSSE